MDEAEKAKEAQEAQEAKYKAMEKMLGEPFGLEFQEDVLKTRRNLLVAAGASIVIWAAGLTITPGTPNGSISPFFGVTLNGMTHRVFLWSMFTAVSYLFIHFLWASFDAFGEYRLRSTGAKVRFQTGSIWADAGIDAPIHPRQSTLYNWWHEAARGFDALPETLEDSLKRLNAAIDDLKVLQQQGNDAAGQNLNQAISSSTTAQAALMTLNSQVKTATETIANERIPVSLERFDKAFQFRAMSQNLRWLILEFGFPVLLGASACVALLTLLFPNWKC